MLFTMALDASNGSVFDSPDFTARLFYPQPDTGRTPPGARDVMVSVDGARLHVRLHRHPDARVLVLLFHGNGERVADYDGLADNYRTLGADLAVMDYRGYGRSTGRPTLRTTVADALPVLAAVRAEVSQLPLVVLGRSLGSVCAAEIAGRALPEVQGIVMESGIAFLDDLIERRGVDPPRPLSARDMEDFDPRGKLARCICPVLVLHGAEDTLILPAEARANDAALTTADHTLVLIPGRGHNDLLSDPRYWTALGTFLDDVVRR